MSLSTNLYNSSTGDLQLCCHDGEKLVMSHILRTQSTYWQVKLLNVTCLDLQNPRRLTVDDVSINALNLALRLLYEVPTSEIEFSKYNWTDLIHAYILCKKWNTDRYYRIVEGVKGDLIAGLEIGLQYFPASYSMVYELITQITNNIKHGAIYDCAKWPAHVKHIVLTSLCSNKVLTNQIVEVLDKKETTLDDFG